MELFESNNDDVLKPFSSYISDDSQEPEEGSDRVEQPQLEEQAAEEEVAVEEPQDSTEQPDPSSVDSDFISYLKNKGFEVADDIDREDFFRQSVEAIQQGAEAQEERASLAKRIEELEAALQRASTQPPAPPVPPAPTAQQPEVAETPKQTRERLFKTLSDYDSNLDIYVTRDERGRAIPRPEYGTHAIEAAMKINSHEAEARRQAELLVANPHLIVEDHKSDFEKLAEEKARAIVEERMSQWQKQQEEQQNQLAQQQAERARQAAEREWYETNKSKIFHLGPDGEPKTSPFDRKQFSYTPVGVKFQETLQSLYNDPDLNSVSDLKLREIALRQAELSTPKPDPEPSKTEAQKRQEKFVQKRQAVPNDNYEPANASQLASAAPGGLSKFADMVRSDPDNQEIVQGW